MHLFFLISFDISSTRIKQLEFFLILQNMEIHENKNGQYFSHIFKNKIYEKTTGEICSQTCDFSKQRENM